MSTKKKHGPKDGRTYLANAKSRWGAALPDWVAELARAADADGNQTKTAKRCGFKSASVVSALINNTYPGPLPKVEQQVRGGLMNATVECPVLGTIKRNDCIANQQLKASGCEPMRFQLVRACKTCPNAIGGKHAAE